MDLGEAFQKPPGVKEKAIWASKLAALVDAGVPIVRSLDLMATQQKLPMFKKALTSVGLEVNQGTAMAAAMRQWPKVFDQLTIAMVEAGEAGGVLDESLKRLAKLLEDNARLQNQIKGALGYPVAVLVIAILVFLGMTIFLIPTFAGIFEDLGAELPDIYAINGGFKRLTSFLRLTRFRWNSHGWRLVNRPLLQHPQRPQSPRQINPQAAVVW